MSKNTDLEFKVFDVTGFKNKPDMSQFGIRSIHMIYSSDFWDAPPNDNKWRYPDKSAIKRELREADKLKSRTVVVDDLWPTNGKSEAVQKSVSHYSSLYYDMKKLKANSFFGYFNTLPLKKYWTKDPSQEQLDRWRAQNNRLKKLAHKVDAFYLPGYTRNKDQEQWVSNMKNLIEETRRIGKNKPIYLFLRPQYYTSKKSLKRKYIGDDFWQLQLDFARKYTDGVVFYHAPYGTQWNESAQWWKLLKQFMIDIGEYSAEPKVSDSKFKVYDGTRFRNKPNMSNLGFTPLEILYPNRLWEKSLSKVGPWELPSKKLVKEWTRKASETNKNITMLNIEHWPNKGSNIDRSIDNFSTVYSWVKEARPDIKVGFYNQVPYKLHWEIYPQKKWITAITDINERLSPLANIVDAYFPSAYTRSRDKKGWLINTKYMIKQAHSYSGDKPVYLVLWPQYHTRNNSKIDGQYIGKEFWKLQLETARKYADGVVIWFPYKTKWSEASAAPWWETTKKFLREMGKAK